MDSTPLIFLFLGLLREVTGNPGSAKSCLPHALRLQRVQAFPVDKDVTATALIKGFNGFFLCAAKKTALKSQSAIACRNFPIFSYGQTYDQFYSVARVGGAITDFKVLSRRQSSLVIAVIKNEPSLLFAVHLNGSYLSFTELGPIGSIGARSIRMVQNRDRVAVVTSSSRLCQNVGHDCNVPGVEVISAENVVTRCVSSEFGASSAATGWPFGRFFYVVHALKDHENPRKMQLKLFRLDESVDPTHCLLEPMEVLDIQDPLCDVHTLRLFRASGMYFLLIGSHDCDKPLSEKSGSTRNILTVQWSPITGLLDGQTLAELKDTDHVREVTSLSASIFLLDRPNIYPSTIHCLTADILRSSYASQGIHRAELDTIATLPPSPGASKFTSMNTNEGLIFLARISDDVKRGHTVEIDQLSCSQDGDAGHKGVVYDATNSSARQGISLDDFQKIDSKQGRPYMSGAKAKGGASSTKQVLTNWIGDLHDYEDSVPLLVPVAPVKRNSAPFGDYAGGNGTMGQQYPSNAPDPAKQYQTPGRPTPDASYNSSEATVQYPTVPLVWPGSRRLKFPEELESEESAYEEIPYAQFIAETTTHHLHEDGEEDYPTAHKGISYVNDSADLLGLEASNVALIKSHSNNETIPIGYHHEEEGHYDSMHHQRVSYSNDSTEFFDEEGPDAAKYGTQQYNSAKGYKVVRPLAPHHGHHHGVRYGHGQKANASRVSSDEMEYDHDDHEYSEYESHDEHSVHYNASGEYPDTPVKAPAPPPPAVQPHKDHYNNVHYEYYDDYTESDTEHEHPYNQSGRAGPVQNPQPAPQLVAPHGYSGRRLHYERPSSLRFDNGPNLHNHSEAVPGYAHIQPAMEHIQEHHEMSYHDTDYENLPPIRYNDSAYDIDAVERRNETVYTAPAVAVAPLQQFPSVPVQLQPLPAQYPPRPLPNGVRYTDVRGLHYQHGQNYRNYSEVLPQQETRVETYNVPLPPYPQAPEPQPQIMQQPPQPVGQPQHGVRYTDLSGIHFQHGPKHRNYSEALPPYQQAPPALVPANVLPPYPQPSGVQPYVFPISYSQHGVRYTDKSGIRYQQGPKQRNSSEQLPPYLTPPVSVPVVPSVLYTPSETVQYVDPRPAVYPQHGVRYTDQSGIHYQHGSTKRNYSEVLPPLAQPTPTATVPLSALPYPPYEVAQYVQAANGTVKKRRLRFYKNDTGDSRLLMELGENAMYRTNYSDSLPGPFTESSTVVADTIQIDQREPASPLLPAVNPTVPGGMGIHRIRYNQTMPTPKSLGIRYHSGPNRAR
ncbi:uncharacterized protein LOC129584098 [Paramacrobiotus metropolitanus]|uniref:uncharacterized protein LOC129584098 n=1 Tax=Paramacrobiotus metropolitanus TaxID=2943436 RepID=UPI00244615AC|nr:uncharacterized protein LOC129584098 [Paramacrobiotus metropolitanus]